MRWQSHALFILMVLACAVAQITLIPRMWEGARPDLLLAVVILLGLFQSPATGSLYSFGIGYLNDILTGSVMGLFMFERVLMFTLGSRLSQQFYAKSAPAQFIIILILSILDVFVRGLLGLIFGQGNTFTGNLILTTPLRAFMTALMGMPLFLALKLIFDTGGGIPGAEKASARMKERPKGRPLL